MNFTHIHTHTSSMKLQASKIPLPKSQTRRRAPQFVLPLISLIFVLAFLPIYYPFFSRKKQSISLQIDFKHNQDKNTIKSTSPLDPPPKPSNPTWRRSRIGGGGSVSPSPLPAADRTVAIKKCDLFRGDWVPDAGGPYYTNETCNAIQEHQNCMKHGRPDTGYLKWRWKPDGCDLPRFESGRFLEMVRGKSLAFVGDSVARNHLQSLICLLSRVATPIDASEATAENRLYEYKDYNFNLSIFSSPYLIRTHKSDPNDLSRPFHLFLDEFDDTWTARIRDFDYVVISGGHWFSRPSYSYLNRTLAGCLYCSDANVTRLPSSFSYRWAFRTALRALGGSGGPVVFLRTLAPSHFEGGPWDNGGDCPRRRPFRRNETDLEDYVKETYRIQVEELGIAGEGRGGKFRLFDATRPMVLRADGHPSKYGREAGANETFPKDCVHWCLPGPIDAWNDLLQELLRREVEVEGYSHES